MRTDEQFKNEVFQRCAAHRQKRARRLRICLSTAACILLVFSTLLVIRGLSRKKEYLLYPVESQESDSLIAVEMQSVKVCSPDGSEVYFTVTNPDDIYTLIGYQPDINDFPEETIKRAQNKSAEADETKSAVSDQTGSGFLVLFTDTEGNSHGFLVTDDASLYDIDRYQEGIVLALREDATALIAALKELGWSET